MRRALILSSICATAWCTTSPVKAMGFGTTHNPSLLGQPLDFAAQVRISADEELSRECVVAEVYAGENRLGSDQIRVQVRPGRDANERAVRVRTVSALNEPVVTINLTVGCTSKMSRQFVAFLDPPMLNLARADEGTPTAVETATRADARVETQFAMAVQPAVEPSAAPSIRVRNRGAERKRNATSAALRPSRSIRVAHAEPSVPKHDARRVLVARASAPAKPAGTARLQLEAAAAPAVSIPAPAASAAALTAGTLTAGATSLTSAAPAQGGANPELEQLKLQLAQERERVRTLEVALARLRSEAEASQKVAGVAVKATVAAAPAAVPTAVAKPESARAASPMLYPLVGLGALLSAAVAVAAWRPKKKAFGTSRWWDPTQQPSTEKSGAVPSRLDSIRSESEDLRAQLPPRVASVISTSRIDELTRPPLGGLDVVMAAPSPKSLPVADTLPAPLVVSITTASAAPSMEALIDLEQEAEFFAVIGQDEAAVALLSKHIQRDGPVSPLPYLKLLEIHRRRGDTAAHAVVGEAFRARFSTSPPTWELSGGGRSLDAYPSTLADLQALWASPREVMPALEAWLFRREPTAETLDLAAYRDLLFLYAVARDRADNGGDSDNELDLVLPFDDAPIDVHLPIESPVPQFERTEPRVSRSTPLDFDISVSASLDESELRQPV